MLHPLLMPTIFFSILFFTTGDLLILYGNEIRLYQLLFIFGCTFLIPLMAMFYLKSTKVIGSLKMEDREDRVLPFTMVCIIYVAGAIMFYLKLNNVYFLPAVKVLAVITFNVIMVTLITYFWKISIHSCGVGGISGLIISMDMFQFQSFRIWEVIGVLLVSGIVMSARLYLRTHTQSQVYLGYLAGFTVSFLAGIFLLWG